MRVVVSSNAALGVGAIALGMVLTPGPNMLYLVSRSITQGRAAGLISLAGVAAGFACYLMAATVGLTAVFAAVPSLYVAVKTLGALYLPGWPGRPSGHAGGRRSSRRRSRTTPAAGSSSWAG